MAERRFLTVSDAVELVTRQPRLDQEAEARMEDEGPSASTEIYKNPVMRRITEEKNRALLDRLKATRVGKDVRSGAIAGADAQAAALAAQRGPRRPA